MVNIHCKIGTEKNHSSTKEELVKYRKIIFISLGETANHVAAWYGHTQVVKIIMNDSRIDVSLQDDEGHFF